MTELEVIDAVAFRLWQRSVTHLAVSKRKDVWTWLPPAGRRLWVAEAAEIVALVRVLTAG